MKLHFFYATSPRSRHTILDVFKKVTFIDLQKNLLQLIHVISGRNTYGVVSSHYRCGSYKHLYRKTDFSRTKLGLPRYIDRIQHDPHPF